MAGSWTVTLRGVRPFTIHGDIYYELLVEQEGGTANLRVPSHAVAGGLVVDSAVTVSFLLGQVTKVVPVE